MKLAQRFDTGNPESYRTRRARTLAPLGERLLDLYLGIRVARDPRLAHRIENLDLVRNKNVRELCRLAREFSEVAALSSTLAVVKLFKDSDRDLCQLTAWLSLAPKCVRKSMPCFPDLLELVRQRGEPRRSAEPPAWERHLAHARACEKAREQL
jgi:hypothetical protein